MSIPKPDKAARAEALRLAKRLAHLKSDWASEPSLSELPPPILAALQHGVQEAEAVWSTIGFVGLFAGILFWIGFSSQPFAWALLIAFGLLVIRAYFLNEQVKRNMVYALTQTSNVMVLPTLIKATHYPFGRAPAALAAIRRLLEQVTEEDAGLLSRDEQDMLWNMAVLPMILRSNADEAFAFSALQALTRIGDQAALAAMRRVANHAAVYPAEHRLNERVRALVPLMEARLQRQKAPQTLLRASAIPDAIPGTLLRAHATPPAEPSKQLLRAGLANTGDTDV